MATFTDTQGIITNFTDVQLDLNVWCNNTLWCDSRFWCNNMVTFNDVSGIITNFNKITGI